MNPMNDASSLAPDQDTIKMFVGQVPKAWNENDIRSYFEEFGKIFMINVLRDKVTKQSRGCCFITYYSRRSALEACHSCHNIKCLPGMAHPIQMKPADNENRHERKIFVGMIKKQMNENDVRQLFSRFGLIEECSILRDGNGVSRGCGFVTFSSKASALNSIKTMHQSTIMEGCSSPIVVKLADTQKEKKSSTKEATGTASGILNLNSAGDTSSGIAQKAQYLSLINLLQQQAVNGYNASQQMATSPVTTLQPTDLTTLTILAGLTSGNFNMTQNLAQQNPINLTQNHGQIGLMPQTGNCNPNLFSLMTGISTNPSPINNPATTNSQLEGPEGSNLFIYHLPQEFTDTDLAQSFTPFGNVLSSKIFIDKTTNLSKCFGFVSYDNPISAQLAIQAMNGFQIGPKRLKVQLKRAKEKPY